MLGVGLAISVIVSWFIGAPVVVLGLGMLRLSPFVTVTNGDVMPGSEASTEDGRTTEPVVSTNHRS